MKRTAIALSLGLLAGLPAALAQGGHEDTHHPAQPPAPAEHAQVPPAPPVPGMTAMPAQCRTMMQAMPAECMSAMQSMMQGGGMMQGGMMHGSQGAMPAPGTAAATPTGEPLPDFTRAYVDAMDAMHEPMMEGVMADDPDTAFVPGMIPHHQGAIDMARIVQRYGDDPQTRKWVGETIAAQEREIAAMEAWLAEDRGAEALDLGGATGTVYSTDEGGSAISAIDLAAGAVTTVPLPLAPHNVDLTLDGRFLLAVGTPAAGAHGGNGHDHAETTNTASGLLAVLDPADLSRPATTLTASQIR